VVAAEYNWNEGSSYQFGPVIGNGGEIQNHPNHGAFEPFPERTDVPGSFRRGLLKKDLSLCWIEFDEQILMFHPRWMRRDTSLPIFAMEQVFWVTSVGFPAALLEGPRCLVVVCAPC
jgi:hypothetical protein